MYKLPENFDGQFFVGRELRYITFSTNNIVFSFDSDIWITAESSLQHIVESDPYEQPVQQVPLSETRLLFLLGRCVTAVEGDELGTLTLSFTDGHILKVFDESEQYESYSFSDGKERTIV